MKWPILATWMCMRAVTEAYGRRSEAYAPLLQLYAFDVRTHDLVVQQTAQTKSPGGYRIWRVSESCNSDCSC